MRKISSKRTHQASKEWKTSCTDPKNTSKTLHKHRIWHVWIQRHALYFMLCLRQQTRTAPWTAPNHTTIATTWRSTVSALVCCYAKEVLSDLHSWVRRNRFFFLMDYLKPHSDRGPRLCSTLTALFGFFCLLAISLSMAEQKVYWWWLYIWLWTMWS